MATDSKTTFDINAERAGYFLVIHEAAQGGVVGAPITPVRELPRAAVVFAVGALDAYLSEVSAEVLIKQIAAATPSFDVRDALRRVDSEIPTLSLEVALVPSQQERTQRIRNAIVDHFHNRVSHHGAKGVSNAVERIGGRPTDVWNHVRSLRFANAHADLDRWTNIRHQIVHQGKKSPVRRREAQRCIKLVSAIAEAVDNQAENLMP